MSALPQPMPPIPVQPIVYSTPTSNRPAIITAIGVISVVIGSLGLLFNGIAGLQALAVVMIANVTQTAAARQAAVSAAVVAPKPVDPLAMPASDRQTVVRGLAMHRMLTKPRREQLDALLTKCGRQIFKLGGADLTVDMVRQNVTDSGRLPDAKGGEGPDFFVIGEGRIELADDHANFAPGDGGEIVRVNAADITEQANWQAGLTPQQVSAVVDRVNALSGKVLTPAQKSTLQATFAGPAQGFFTTAPTIPEVTAQVNSVSYNATNGVGQLVVTTGQGMLTLDAQGNVLNSTTWGGGAAAGGPAFAGPRMTVNKTAAVAAIAGGALGIILSIYLLVIGILMLRQYPRAGFLHKAYAVVKIPVAIAASIAWVMLWSSIVTGASTTTAQPLSPGLVSAAVIAAIVGCAYPIFLLIALRSRAAREYYSPVVA